MSETIDAVFEETAPAVRQKDQPVGGVPSIVTAFGDISTPEGLQRALATIENSLIIKQKVIEIALKTGDSAAWDDMEGKPTCSEAEVERLLAMLSVDCPVIRREISWEKKAWHPESESWVEDRQGHFSVETEVELSHPLFGRWTGVGYCDSRDTFLGTNNGRPSKKSGKVKTLEDVSYHSIQQMSRTRAIGNVGRKVLGLAKFTWGDLEQHGYFRGKGGTIAFRAEHGGTDPGAPKSPPPPGQTREGPRAPTPEEKAEQQKHRAEAADEAQRAKVKKRMFGAMKKRNVSFGAATEHARNQHGYKGDKIIDAPTDVMEAILADLDAGKLAGPPQDGG